MISNNWNEIVKNYDSKIYLLYEWGELLNKVHGHKIINLQTVNGVFPVAYVKSHIFGNRLLSLPFADYGGPCTNDIRTADNLISMLEDAAGEINVDFIEIRSPCADFFDLFEKHGFIRRDDYFTFILDLDDSIEGLWNIIGKKNRNMVRKAEKNGIKVVELKNKAELKIFYSLYLKTMKKLGSPPQPFNFFETMWDLFHPNNLVIILSKFKDSFIGGNLYFLHNNIIHHSYNCSLKSYLELGQNNLMQWYLIKWGNQNGFRHLDLGRTREKAGNELFKRRWSGKLIKMPYFYKFYKKKLDEREEIKYEQLSKLWSRYMPESVANKIGPLIIRQIG